MVYLYEIAQLYELPSRNKLRSLNQLATGYRRAGRIVMRRRGSNCATAWSRIQLDDPVGFV